MSDTTSQVLLTDDTGHAARAMCRRRIVDNGTQDRMDLQRAICRMSGSSYPTLTINYGLRFDRFTAFTSDSQVSPRINLVWQALTDTTVHAGYSRYLSPPPFELVGGKDIAQVRRTRPRRRCTPWPRRRSPSTPITTTSACSRKSRTEL